jgi:hypothetical protein
MDPGELTAVVAAGVSTVINAAQAVGQLGGARRGKGERDQVAEVSRRMLYGEVLFNLFALRVGAKVLPPRFVQQDVVYRGLISSGHLELVGEVDVITEVAVAYTVSGLTVAAFDVDWLQLAVMRARGIDCQSIEGLASHFRAAEAVLRPVVWNETQCARLESALRAAEALEPIPLPPVFNRLQSAGLSVPGSLLTLGLCVATFDLARSWDNRKARRVS